MLFAQATTVGLVTADEFKKARVLAETGVGDKEGGGSGATGGEGGDSAGGAEDAAARKKKKRKKKKLISTLSFGEEIEEDDQGEGGSGAGGLREYVACRVYVGRCVVCVVVVPPNGLYGGYFVDGNIVGPVQGAT